MFAFLMGRSLGEGWPGPIVCVFKKLSNCLPKGLYDFVFPLATNDCSTSLSAFDAVSVLYFSHSNVYSGISLLF